MLSCLPLILTGQIFLIRSICFCVFIYLINNALCFNSKFISNCFSISFFCFSLFHALFHTSILTNTEHFYNCKSLFALSECFLSLYQAVMFDQRHFKQLISFCNWQNSTTRRCDLKLFMHLVVIYFLFVVYSGKINIVYENGFC